MDTLPKGFKSWNEFYLSFSGKIVKQTSIIRYDEILADVTEPTGLRRYSYEYTVQEVKAHCFDEFVQFYTNGVGNDPRLIILAREAANSAPI